MACYHPLHIVHPTRRKWKRDKYIPNSYENMLIPNFLDVPCGKCPQCIRRRARDWKVRIMAEHARFKYRGCRFVTLTFSDEMLFRYWKGDGSPKVTQRYENYDISLIVRRFLENLRKRTGKSVRHVFIPEFGSSKNHTKRLHIHGILFGCFLSRETLESSWRNGFIHVHNYCDARTSGYITKYLTKDITTRCPVFVSAGIGDNLVNPSLRRKVEKTLRSIPLRLPGKSDLRLNFNGYLYGMPLYIYNKLTDWFERFSYSLYRNPLEFAGILWPDESTLSDYKSYLASLHSGPPKRPSLDSLGRSIFSVNSEFSL